MPEEEEEEEEEEERPQAFDSYLPSTVRYYNYYHQCQLLIS